MRRVLATIGALLLGSACSVFGSFDEFSSEDPPAEGGAPEGAAQADVAVTPGSDAGGDASTSDASDADATTPTNIHPFPSFENGCQGWGSYKGTLAPSNVARTGNGSCLVCPDNSASDQVFTADDQGPIDAPPIGAMYAVELWVRKAPTKAAARGVAITLRTRNTTPSFTIIEQNYTPGVDEVTDTWAKITGNLVITKPAQGLNIVVQADFPSGGCFLLDDVLLYRTK